MLPQGVFGQGKGRLLAEMGMRLEDLLDNVPSRTSSSLLQLLNLFHTEGLTGGIIDCKAVVLQQD